MGDGAARCRGEGGFALVSPDDYLASVQKELLDFFQKREDGSRLAGGVGSSAPSYKLDRMGVNLADLTKVIYAEEIPQDPSQGDAQAVREPVGHGR